MAIPLFFLKAFQFIQANFGDWLLQWDAYFFEKINTQFTNPFLDNVYPWWRDANTWTPLYVFLLAFMFLNFGKQTWGWLLFAIITVTLTDQVSSNLIKHYVARPRPCADLYMQYRVRLLLSGCSGGYSFTSSHATNHFGMATFFYLTLKPFVKNWGNLFFIWAATIAYGQVYVGVHYPLDVICGAILGCLLGSITANIYNRKLGLIFLEN